MKSRLSLLILLSMICGAVALPALAQQGVGRGPISMPRDPELEKQSQNSLQVARFYFYKRKPPKNDKAALERLNKAVESRLLEIIDLNPTFAKMDEVYFMLGEVSARSGNLDQAKDYYQKVIKEYPDSQVLGDAKKRLAEVENQEKSQEKGQEKGL